MLAIKTPYLKILKLWLRIKSMMTNVICFKHIADIFLAFNIHKTTILTNITKNKCSRIKDGLHYVQCDLNFLRYDISLPLIQGNDKPLGHPQQLCEIRTIPIKDSSKDLWTRHNVWLCVCMVTLEIWTLFKVRTGSSITCKTVCNGAQIHISIMVKAWNFQIYMFTLWPWIWRHDLGSSWTWPSYSHHEPLFQILIANVVVPLGL